VTTGADRLDDAHALVSRRERQLRLHGPITVRRVDVGVAETGRLDLDDDLAGPRNRLREILDLRRLVEAVYDNRAHRLRCGLPRCRSLEE
jgi:hypothetical protein